MAEWHLQRALSTGDRKVKTEGKLRTGVELSETQTPNTDIYRKSMELT